jgi:FtsP/CotA-like multicopper oxidase with cupredoxin domain
VRAAKARGAALLALKARGNMAVAAAPVMNPGGTPDYFGTIPNYANSPLPASVGIIGDGTGAAARVNLTPAGVVASITVTKGGSGYTDAATVANLVGGGGTGAVLAPVINSGTGAITSINVVNGGTGYNLLPGIRKFVDSLPGLGLANKNDLNQYIPVAVADTTSYPGSGTFGNPGYVPAADYYEIALVQYTEKLHQDLPATLLRGYVQVKTTNAAGYIPISCNGITLYEVEAPQYLGPLIIAGSYDPIFPVGVSGNGKPTRIKFHNCLSAGSGGNLFIPVDTSAMGAGMGPKTAGGATCNPITQVPPCASYTENRATLHLHGGNTPWISDGTPHQWTTPATETTPYPEGVSVYNVPDMDGGVEPVGTLTFYYTNEQSARLMFYHDHAYGLTRLNVYAGEAAGYLVTDPVEQALVTAGTIPPLSDTIPLIIQDKTFVPSQSQLAQEDPTWNWGSTPGTVHVGDLWFPHVYMPNQNPFDSSGANAVGRWDYGPWFWPPFTTIAHGPIPNPLYPSATNPLEGPYNPGIPSVSMVPEGYMDTPLINGTAYPFMSVLRKAYRFLILNASNDRMLNLQLYCAKSNGTMWNISGALADANVGEVNMVPAVATAGFPVTWPTDGRAGGVPDPTASGPTMIQIGTEGGLLPAPAVIPNQPVGYLYDRRNIVVLNVTDKALFLGPAERADVVVDFSQVPTSCSNIILYNDSPAPVPAFDPRNDYYTGGPDNTGMGGAPSTQPGYGPNTRTLMQIRVSGTAAPAYNLSALQTALPAAFAASQPAPIVPQDVYNAAYPGANYPTDAYARIQDMSMTFAPAGTTFIGSVKVTNGGSAYASLPDVSITGATGSGATATATVSGGKVTAITVTNGGSGYTGTSVTITGGSGSLATASATVVGGIVAGITVTDGGSGYTFPTVDFVGGSGSGAAGTLTVSGGAVTAVTLTNGGTGYTSSNLPTVVISGGGGTGAAGIASLAVVMPLGPKAIQELFTLDYGRMNATMGVEIPSTNGLNQTTIPLGYIDPTTEIVQNSDSATPLASLADGTQIWKITHNGVDTHAIHFHMFNVQVINRVGWDGAIRPVDPNELGWKDTVRMNPLEDAIVALRPIIPVVPFEIPNSVRPFDVTIPIGTQISTTLDPLNNPITVFNALINYGWEYVWHCHLLGHEENDMMRPMIIGVAPAAPTSLAATGVGGVHLTWNDNSLKKAGYSNLTGFTVQRATDPAFTINLTSFSVPQAAGVPQTYTDTTAIAGTLYYYKVFAANKLGGAASGYPEDTILSAPSNVVKFPTNLYYLTVISPYGTVAKVLDQPSYSNGDSVSLTATAIAGWTFMNWSGAATGSSNPVSVTFGAADLTVTANYRSNLPSISGNAGVGGATLTYTGGSTVADAGGNYSFNIASGWTGTVTPTKPGYTFSPVSRTYSTGVTSNQTGQNYTASPIPNSISGTITLAGGTTGLGGVTLSYTDGSLHSANTVANGDYAFTVSNGWTGTVTPDKTGYTFSPVSRTYNAPGVTSGVTAQNYTATPVTYTISGLVTLADGVTGVANVTITASDGATTVTATTNGTGAYSLPVLQYFAGTVTPSLPGYSFAPVNMTYPAVSANQTAQNYIATPIFGISGNAGASGAVLTYTDGVTTGSTIANSAGFYFISSIPSGWSGTVTPSLAGYTFGPANRTYTNVTTSQTLQDYSSTAITYTIRGNAGLSGTTLSYTNGVTSGTTSTDPLGNYIIVVPYNWSGTVTPSQVGYAFSPFSRTYTNVLSDQTGQNYTSLTIAYTISGSLGASGAGATLSYTDGGTPFTVTADGSGNYTLPVSFSFTGAVTPTKTGFTFSPIFRNYPVALVANLTGQNYVTTAITYTISGTISGDLPPNAGVAGVTLSYMDGTLKTVNTDASGNYSLTVSYNWTGTVTPAKTGYVFSPVNRIYTNLLSDQTAQNYIVSLAYRIYLPIIY